MNRKVWVTNHNAAYDYSNAEQFGELVYMSQGFIPSNKLDNLFETFENYAKTASENDLLLLSGSNLVCALAAIAWNRHHPNMELMQHGKVLDEKKQPVSSYIFYNVKARN